MALDKSATQLKATQLKATLLAFNADIYGEHMWSEIAVGDDEPPPTHVECRVDPWLIPVLKNVLAINERVIEVSVRRPHYTWDVGGKVLSILGKSIKELDGTATCHLDVMLLAMSRSSLYIRLAYDAFEQHPEVKARGQITHLMDRIKAKRFCLLPGALESGEAMNRAFDLVNKGWVMDNMIVPSSWIIQQQEQLGQCAICRDDVKQDEIVITLHCGHSFHVYCPGSQGSGIYSWFQEHGKRTCPMCRSVIA
jgi:hypothetical protein